MDQNPNTPPHNKNPMSGFAPYGGEFMSLLTQGLHSPNIPNQPQFPTMPSPTIPFHQLSPFQQAQIQQAQFQQAQFQQFQQSHSQSYEMGGGSSQASMPMFSTQRPSLDPVNETQPEAPKKGKKR